MFKTMGVALCTSIVINGIFYSALKRPEIATVDIVSITSQFIKKEAQKNHIKCFKSFYWLQRLRDVGRTL